MIKIYEDVILLSMAKGKLVKIVDASSKSTSQTKHGKYSSRLSNTSEQGFHQSFRISDPFFRQIVDSLEDYAVFTTDKDGNISSWNIGAQKIFGYTEKEIISKNAAILFIPEDRKEKKPEQELQSAVIKGKARDEKWHVRKNGERFWGFGLVFPLNDEQGNLRGFTKITRDLTEKLKTEEKLKQVKDQLETTFQNVPSGITLFDKNGTILFANQLGAYYLGYSSTDELLAEKDLSVLRKRFLKAFSVEDESGKPFTPDMSPITRALKGERNSEIVFRYYSKKKKTAIWVLCRGNPILNEKGTVQMVLFSLTDITKRKLLEMNLTYLAEASKILASSLDYKTTLHSVAKLAVLEIADWCAISMIENGTLKQVTLAHKDPKKVRWAKEINKKYPPDMNALIGVPHVIRTGKSEFYPEITDEMLVKAGKDEKHLKLLRNLGLTSAMIVPIWVEKKCIGAVSFVTTKTRRIYTKDDLTMAEELADRAGLAIENARLYAEAQQAINLRNDFISVASHELKTPVTSLKMYTQVLQKQFEKRYKKNVLVKYFKKMDSQIDRLTVLIADLLNVARIQAGKLEFHKEAFNVNELVKETQEAIQEITQKHKITIEGEIPKNVWGDKDRIGQVLTNLLTNAVKYSPQADKIIVRLTPEKDTAVVSVQDFGIGIEKDHQSKIFNRFYRVSSPNEKTFPGLGLGLYISNEIVRRHGGIMNVVSSKGGGSIFSFTLPYTDTAKR